MPIVQVQKTSVKTHQGQVIESLRLSPSIEQLDVTTVWTNLSIRIAEILFEMNRVIGPCLESVLAARLQGLDVAARKEYSPFKGNLSGELNDTSPLLFSLDELIDSMLEEIQFHCYYHMSLQSPEVLVELMMLYLISLNSIDEFDGLANADAIIHIGLRPGEDILSDIVPPPTAHVVQHLDYLSFPGLEVMPREGTAITIIPQYSRCVFKKTNDSYSEVSYVMQSKPSWLEWDDEISGWKGNLPLYSEWRGKSKNSEEVISGGRVGPYAVVNLLRLEVKAVLIERHSSASVRLKRTVRARLTLKVIPWYAHENTHASHGHPQPKKMNICRYNDDWLSPTRQIRSKADLSPASPRKYVDEHFGLGCDKLVFDAISQQDLQVYSLSNHSLDWRPSALPGAHLENVHNVHQPTVPLLRRFVPCAYDGAGAWSTEGVAHIARGSDLYTSSNDLAADPMVSREASSKASHSSDRSQRIPSSRNRETWSLNDRGLDTRDRAGLRATKRMKRHRSDHLGNTIETSLNGNQDCDHHVQASDDELHWQDPEEFGSEYFDEHERLERRHSLHNASPELFDLAELLHERCSQTEEDSAVQSVENECLSPTQLSDVRAGDKKADDEAGSACLKDVRREVSLSDRDLHAPPRVTFFLNRYSALWGLEEQDSSQVQPPERLATPVSDRMEIGQHVREDSGYLSETALIHSEEAVVDTLGNLDSQHTKALDSMADDPQLRKEQELLWNLLASKERDGDERGIKDRKLEAEEKKGLWEVLRWEAWQKQRKEMSEDMLGMEIPDEGEDNSSGGESDGSLLHYEGDDSDMQGTWNFGC